MIRFVVGPDRHVVPDLAARLPGRGMWLSARRDVIETARTRGALRAMPARGPVSVPPTSSPCSGGAGPADRRVAGPGPPRRAGGCRLHQAREWLDAAVPADWRRGWERGPNGGGFLGQGRQISTRCVTPLDAAAWDRIRARSRSAYSVAPGRLAETAPYRGGSAGGARAVSRDLTGVQGRQLTPE